MSGHTPPEPPRLFQTLKGDIGQVIDDVRRRGIRREINATFDSLEKFYLSEETRQRLAKKPLISRMALRFWLLIRGLLMKLTPARRVMLALAFILLLFGAQHYAFGDVEIAFNWRSLGTLLLVFVLMLELKDKLVARDELEAGRAVQLALLPQSNPIVPGWDVWMYTEPANDVGGDLVDYIQIDDSHHGVALGDVAGKALPAALLMVKLQATLRALVPEFDTLSKLGAGVNRLIERDGLANRFATLVYLVFTPDSGTVRVLNCGHPPPLVVRGNVIEEMPRGSVALGIVADATFAEQRADLNPGDMLVVYSDGVTEGINPAGDFFGEDRLRAAIGSTAGQSASGIGKSIVRALRWFVDDAPPHDDVSLVVLRRS